MKPEPAKSCRTCWFSGLEPHDEIDVYKRAGRFRWVCALDRRPAKPPYVCTGHAPDQGRGPSETEIRYAREFP